MLPRGRRKSSQVGQSAAFSQSSTGPAVGRRIHGGGNLSCPSKVGGENSAGRVCGDGGAAARVLVGAERGGAERGQACRTRKVANIFTWLQSFASYVVVRGAAAPELIPELMAYQVTIVRVSQDFLGLAWVRYDQAYQRQAALTGHFKWSVINATLYTMCFTGLATVQKRCELCLATSHTEQECAQVGYVDPGLKERLKTIESAMVALMREENSLDYHQLGSCRSRRPAGSGTARVARSPGASIATHAAAVGATTQPADAVLGPRRAAGACRGRQHQAVLARTK